MKNFREKVSNRIKRGFYGELLYNEIYLKTKLKSYKGKMRVLEQVKNVVLKSLWKNVKMLVMKNGCLSILLMT